MRLVFALAAAFSLALAPVVAAGHTPACSSSGGLVNTGVVYVTHAGATGLWVETNGVPGLQKADCTYGGRHVEMDTRVPPEVLGLCVFGVPVVSGCY